MIQPDDSDAHRTGRWPRFTLRFALVLLTIVCLALAWCVARHRQAERFVAKCDAVVSGLIEGHLSPPEGMALATVDTMGLWAKKRGDIESFFHVSSDRADSRVWDAAMRGRHVGSSILGCTYQTTPGATATPVAVVRDRIRSHYGDPLAALGLSVGTGEASDDAAHSTSRDVWRTPQGDCNVIIDVDAEGDSARVSILVLYSQQFGVL